MVATKKVQDSSEKSRILSFRLSYKEYKRLQDVLSLLGKMAGVGISPTVYFRTAVMEKIERDEERTRRM